MAVIHGRLSSVFCAMTLPNPKVFTSFVGGVGGCL